MPTEARSVRINPIPHGGDSAMCVIKALLVVAFHTGQIEGDVRTALNHWFGTPARTIRWKYGERPVVHRTLISLDPVNQTECFEIPGTPAQLGNAISRMAEQCGIMGRITSHDIRRGAAAEISRMPQEATQNVSVAASLMGHSVRTLLSGVTNDYIGDPDIDFWEWRRKQQAHIFHRDPMVSSEPFEAPVVTNDQIREFRRMYPDSEGKSESVIRCRIIGMAKKTWENRMLNPSGPSVETGSQPQVRHAGVSEDGNDDELEDVLSSRFETDEDYIQTLADGMTSMQYWMRSALAPPPSSAVQTEQSVSNPPSSAVQTEQSTSNSHFSAVQTEQPTSNSHFSVVQAERPLNPLPAVIRRERPDIGPASTVARTMPFSLRPPTWDTPSYTPDRAGPAGTVTRLVPFSLRPPTYHTPDRVDE